MHVTLEVAQTIFLSENRKQILQGRVLVIEVQCSAGGLSNETKTQPSITSFKNSLRVLNFDRAF